MASNSTNAYTECLRLRDLANNTFDKNDYELMNKLCGIVYDSEVQGKIYSSPMLWIGIYVAAASLFCILFMAADLIHGFQNHELWFPSKYFSINAVSITLIPIAMKLPVDLNSPMPGAMDQMAKVGSMSFMCIMMANIMPSLASLENYKELFTNVAGMVILVVTMIVNILIEIKTDVVQNYHLAGSVDIHTTMYLNLLAMFYLLLLMISSALTIPTSKRILESKYQAVERGISNDFHSHHRWILSRVEEITQRVRKYWVMAATSSPQFVMATTPLFSAAGIICAFTASLHCYGAVNIFIIEKADKKYLDYRSDYKWSMLMIYITQTIGIVVGTIAPLFRCFAALSFKLSVQWIKKHTKVCQVENYWTQTLSEWKKIRIAFALADHVLKPPVYKLSNLTLNVWIVCQRAIVVSSKILGLIPVAMVIIGVYSWKSLKTKLFAMCVGSNHETRHTMEENRMHEGIIIYALQLQDEVELGIRTLKRMSYSFNRSIRKAEKRLPNTLLTLLEQFDGFRGVVNFDSDNIPPLCIGVEFPNTWSLPVATLTCIAITLPNISHKRVDSLFKSVCAGLSYIFIVESSLNNMGEYAKILKATAVLWREVEDSYEWLGNTLQRNAYRDKNPKEIVNWFAEKSQVIVTKMRTHMNEEELLVESCGKFLFSERQDLLYKLIAVDSMYRVTQTIRVNYANHIEHNRAEELFGLLSGMIVDIMVACFTNLPRLIAIKCHEDAIEKREASVRYATMLFGITKKIFEKLPSSIQVPASLDPNEMAFIDEWRVHLKQSSIP